jgi:DNA invertase Pin-like site-specific DNA recombinase
MQAVGYARVSTKEQTTLNQVDLLKKDGVIAVFCDDGVSGTKPALDRTEYREMMRYLSAHPDTRMIKVYELSRLGRNMQDVINTFLDLEKQGYIIWSLTEAWTQQTDKTMRELMMLIVSWMNKQELTRLSQRTKDGMNRARDHGTKSGKPIGKPPADPNKELVEHMRKEGKKWGEIAGVFHMDTSTLFRYRQVWKRKEINRKN